MKIKAGDSVMRGNLYMKMVGWLVMNLILLGTLGLAFLGYLFVFNSEGLLPAYLFSSKVENLCRIISTNLQYQPTDQWGAILETYNKTNDYTFHLVSLADLPRQYSPIPVPDKVIDAARRIPETLFTLCPDPDAIFRGRGRLAANYEEQDMGSGLISPPPAVFMRAGEPTRYWYARAMFVPEKWDILHYVLLAVDSSSLTGYGLFFNMRVGLFAVMAVIFISCLWWWPFIWYITKPIAQMSDYAEQVAANSYDPSIPPKPHTVFPGRSDEIGRLGVALSTMTRKLSQQMTGQKQFIQHIAHELNTPLAHCRMALGVLEDKSEAGLRGKVQDVVSELDNISRLTDDVLDFLRANASPTYTRLQCLPLAPTLVSMVRNLASGAEVQMDVPPGSVILADADCLRRSLENVLRNAVTYAGDYGPITIHAKIEPGNNADGDTTVLIVTDSGPGVPEEDLTFLFEPFFRGTEIQSRYPGGSGLGMAIVKNSVELCGGSVNCENIQPSGFRVTMRFRTGNCQQTDAKK